MASISTRKNKNGEIISYRIRVSRGYDIKGNKIKPYEMTYKPAPGMTDKQIEKLDPLNANTGTVDYSFKVRKYKHGVRFEGEKEGGEISLFDEVAK